MIELIVFIGKILGTLILLLLGVAYLTYVERKIIAAMQLRKGPEIVGPFGLLQPIADGLKLLHKESIIPTHARTFWFLLAPLLTFVVALSAWAVIPIDAGRLFADVNLGGLYLLALSSFGVYGVLMAGWASQSAYAFLGALRTGAQMISYELSMSLVLVSVLLCANSLNLSEIVLAQQTVWFIVPLFPMFIIFVISALAESNRAPFDLPEAESELVAGYHVEYSSMFFAFFFLGEYANLLLMAAMGTIFFLGGWLAPFNIPMGVPGYIWFFIKMAVLLFIFIWTRASLPRFRYDQLMRMGWKIFIPFGLGWIMIVAGVKVICN
jgi:NADH-quinone oxidoreductase subunit H